ncbi:MAG: peroxiredoxin [Candidatus Tectomicrobia bacterium]|uniref:Peroxiredoxin n=1 Tax=Tectimicrobiota bacterium TaxID=2528274 RepID=A0A932MPT0_UNCTE|nr:peroxiredoxin [Candidatus Tectomicrobia bacterium]
MARSDDIMHVPPGLPIPVDDGACRHVPGMSLPSLYLPTTGGRAVNLAEMPGRTVVYVYPRTGHPDREPPTGWDEIPGARGCTPQSCAFRDHYQELRELNAALFGLSTQDTLYQREAARRLRLPFELLSDKMLAFQRALRLPTFEIEGMILLKRATLIAREGWIEKVFYPVFPPDRNAEDVISWLKPNP